MQNIRIGIQIRQKGKIAVFRIHRIPMFLGLPDPDPLVSGMDPDPDPSIILLSSFYHQAIIERKPFGTLYLIAGLSYYFVTSFGFFIFEK